MKKKILFFTVALLLSIAKALAQGGTTGPLTWNLDNGTLTISGEGVMPNYAYGGAPWFVYRESIHSVVIETGTTSIGDYAFLDCTNLTSIIFSNSVTTIGWQSFFYCISLTSITIPNSVTSIKKGAFHTCINLISITLPDNITRIENGTFYNCKSLPSINIPNNVTAIGNSAFFSCTSLTSVTIPSSVTSIENFAFYYCTSLASMSILNGVTTIGEMSLAYCTSLTSIIIPSSVITIGSNAFFRSKNLSSITLSNGVRNIGGSAFYATGLISITIPGSVTTIGQSVFGDCFSLTSIDVENENNSYTSKNGVLFNKSKNTLICYPAGKTEASYVIPGSVTNISSFAFSDCPNLISIEVESENNSFTSKDGVLFNKSKTTLICCPGGKTGGYIISNNVTSLGDGAFCYCPSLTSITLPNSITTIGISAFWGCSSLTSIIIPNGVTAIEYGTFIYCTNLTSITLPSSITRIRDIAFSDCPNLTLITNLNPVPTATYVYAFDGLLQHLCTLKVPTSAVSAYQNADRWKKFNIVGGGISVNPIANNNKYGYTMGEGLYEENEEVDVMAVARDGYKFVRWTKGGVEVSDRALYSFTVTEDVELVAHFEAEVGIEELQVTSYELQVYPNPTRGEVRISISDYPICDVRLFDIVGHQISIVGQSEIGQSEIRKSEIAINMAHLPAGIYFLRIQTENGVVVRKVVKQ